MLEGVIPCNSRVKNLVIILWSSYRNCLWTTCPVENQTISLLHTSGWIMLKGRQEEVDQNTVLEYCITRLQESMKDM